MFNNVKVCICVDFCILYANHYLLNAEVCSNGVGGYFKLGGEKFEQGTVKTRWTWGILSQENFEKVEGNATLPGSN
jgi:hypothetical protein